MPDRRVRIGVDVGGTFTDAVLIDGPQVFTAKSPTTAQIGEGVLAACALAAERAGTALAQVLPRVECFGLGTTAVTNAIASRKGLRTGLLITRGFEETLRLSRGHLVEEPPNRPRHRPRLRPHRPALPRPLPWGCNCDVRPRLFPLPLVQQRLWSDRATLVRPPPLLTR